MAKGYECPECKSWTLFKREGGLYRCSGCGGRFIRIVHYGWTEWMEHLEDEGAPPSNTVRC